MSIDHVLVAGRCGRGPVEQPDHARVRYGGRDRGFARQRRRRRRRRAGHQVHRHGTEERLRQSDAGGARGRLRQCHGPSRSGDPGFPHRDGGGEKRQRPGHRLHLRLQREGFCVSQFKDGRVRRLGGRAEPVLSARPGLWHGDGHRSGGGGRYRQGVQGLGDHSGVRQAHPEHAPAGRGRTGGGESGW